MATGWIELSGSRYYLAQGGDFQGAMTTGWLYDGGAWYYAKASGHMASGWELIGGAWYWFDSDNGCAMAQGCATIDGQDYLLANMAWLTVGSRMPERGITVAMASPRLVG